MRKLAMQGIRECVDACTACTAWSGANGAGAQVIRCAFC